MYKWTNNAISLVVAGILLFAGCSKDDDDPIILPQPTSLSVTQGTNTPSAGSVDPFAAKLAVLQLTVTAGLGGSVRVQSITFTETGTADAQNDVASIGLYVDGDDDGTYSTAADTVVLGSQAGGYTGADTVTFSTIARVVSAGTSESWLLVYSLAGSASAGDTFIASVAGASDVTAEPVSTGPATTVSGPPVTGNTLTAQIIGSFTVALGGSSPAAANLPVPPTAVPMAQIELDPTATEDVDISAITFTAGGTGDANADISTVTLYDDQDGSGTVTGGDVQIGAPGTFTAGTVTFGGLSQTLSGGNAQTWLVVCTFTGGSYGDTYSVNLASNSNITATGATSVQPLTPTGAPVNGNDQTQGTTGTLDLQPGDNNPVAGNILNPPVNAPMLQFQIEAGSTEDVVVSQVVFTAGGTGNADVDVSSVSLYMDLDDSGSLTAGDTQIGSSTTFSGGTATFGSLTETIAAGAAGQEIWLAVATFTGGASGDKLTVRLADASAVTATGALSSSGVVPTGAPVNGSAQTLQIGSLTVAAGTNNPVAGPLPVPMNNVPMLQVRLEAGNNEDVSVTSILLTAAGTGNADTDISAVDLWNDVDGTGTLTAGDTAIAGPGVFTGGVVTFSSLTETITAGAANGQDWLVVCSFQGGTAGNTYDVSVVFATDVTAAGAASAYSITPTGGATGNTQTMTVAPMVITTKRLPFAQAGFAYTFTMQATGGTTPYSWVMSVGNLPAGLSLAATGVISGTPTAIQGSIFTVQATDSGGTPQVDTQVLAIEVDPNGATSVTVVQGGGGSFTTITAAIVAIPNPLSGTHIIEIQDNATYSENVDVTFTPQGGNNARVILRAKYDNTPVISAPNANDHVVDIQQTGVSLWGLRITGATGTGMCGVNVQTGLWMTSVTNCVIYGNDVAIDNAGNFGTDIVNNTCYGQKGLHVGGGGSCRVQNNIVWVTGAWAHYEYPTPAITCDYNLYHAPNGAVGYDGTTFYTTLAAWQAYFGSDSNSGSGNPNLVNPTGGDFHPTASSALAIDQGTMALGLFTDAEGYARNQGTAWDIGAYEYH